MGESRPFLLTLRCNRGCKHAVAQVHFGADGGFVSVDRCRMCMKDSAWRVGPHGLEAVDPAQPKAKIVMALRCAHSDCRQKLGSVHFVELHGVVRILCCASCKKDSVFRCGPDGVTGEAVEPAVAEPEAAGT